MINSYAIAFVATAATIVAGVDYFDQSSKAGLSLGQMSVSDYAATIPARFSDAKEEKLAEVAERERKSRWRQGGLVYLPEAPEGWTRRALMEGDDSAIMPAQLSNTEDCACDSFLKQMEARDQLKEAKKRAERSWVYQRGSETVFVEVNTFQRPDNNSLIGLVASTIASPAFGNFERTAGYSVVGGVAFTENLSSNGKREFHYRALEASLGFGDEIHIRIHANASRDATHEILRAIDYDGLNNMLPLPMETVGNDIALPENADVIQLSKYMHRLREEFLTLRATEAQYRMSNLDTNAMLINMYSQAYGGADGVMDITGGKVADLGTLITLGYRTARNALIEGKSAEAIRAEVDEMVTEAMKYADAETAAAAERAANAPLPEMSPELEAELHTSQAAASDGVENDALALTADQRLQDIDPVGTAELPGWLVSHRLAEPVFFRNAVQTMNLSEDDIQRSMHVDIVRFAAEHGISQGDCKFSSQRYRIECRLDDAELEDVLARAGLAGDPSTSAKAAVSEMVVSKRLPEDKIRKIQENPNDPAMKMGLELAVKKFEEKVGLADGSCEFSMTDYRVECDPSKEVSDVEEVKPSLASNLLGQLGFGGQDEQQAPKPVAKPQRLKLSSEGQPNGNRCVGSFCN